MGYRQGGAGLSGPVFDRDKRNDDLISTDFSRVNSSSWRLVPLDNVFLHIVETGEFDSVVGCILSPTCEMPIPPSLIVPNSKQICDIG